MQALVDQVIAPGGSGLPSFASINAYEVDRWLGELRVALVSRDAQPVAWGPADLIERLRVEDGIMVWRDRDDDGNCTFPVYSSPVADAAGWRPIESAPKDGTVVRLPLETHVDAFWCRDLKRWVLVHPLDVQSVYSANRWMPPPPTAELQDKPR